MPPHFAADDFTIDFAGLTMAERLRRTRAATQGRIVFTTSFGLEDQAITHEIFAQALAIDVVTLDTGRLFPETYALWSETEMRYGRRIRAVYPERDALEALVADQGIDGFRLSIDARKACCHARKVEPLGRALAGAEIWITGLRAEQSAARASVTFAAPDPAFGLLKVNPLMDWTREATLDYANAVGAPLNVLHARGFPSIGCAPCTRAVAPGEPERAGRWWWEQDGARECGLHVGADGRLTRARNEARA